jgi:hypothetical protein
MRSSKAAIAAILSGAVALASAAYGIGTQTGDGNAAARDGDERESRSGPVREPGLFLRFDGLADELGVDAEELRDTLADFHEREFGERRDAFATALAEALGKPVDEVEAALEEVRPGEGMRPGCAPHVSLRRLAAELDVSRSELRKALREARADEAASMDAFHDDLIKFLADRFGLSEDEVEQALPEPPRFDRHGPGGPRPFAPGGPPSFGLDVRPG